MKFRFVKANAFEVIAYGTEKNDVINLIESICENDNINLIGYKNTHIKELNPVCIECFFTEGDKVYTIYEKEKYLIKKRLYELSNLFKETFIYINQGCLVNVNAIDHFDVTIGASLQVTLKSGYKDFVSRRMLKTVKERIGLKQ